MSITIALAGNPNCGKTTLFNEITGSKQHVGNWPGVTVDKKDGIYKKDRDVTILDLPGTYSLSPYSAEEIVARDYLVKERPDAVINIVDGTSIERNLYLTLQIAETQIPMVVAMNMMDEVESRGDKIDCGKLSEELGGFRVAVGIFVGRFYQGIDGGYFPLRQCFPDNLIIFHQLDGFPVVLLIGPAQHIGDGGDSIG